MTLGVAAALLALAVAAWIAWRPGASPTVVVDLPAPAMRPPPAVAAHEPAANMAARGESHRGAARDAATAAAGQADAQESTAAAEPAGQADAGEQLAADTGAGRAGLDAAIAAERARGGPYEKPAAAASGEAGDDIADEPFTEVPLAVTGGSNLRTRPTVASARVMWVARGSAALLLDPTPVRGYYKVSIGEREGWIWHLNVEPADIAPTDEEQSGGAPASEAAPADADPPSIPAPSGQTPTDTTQ